MTAKEYLEMIEPRNPNKGAQKKNKYGNKITYVGNIRFDSKKESERYLELLILVKAKKITDLKLQYAFELVGSELLAGEIRVKEAIKYVCDFYYYDVEKKRMVVEDVKSAYTSKLKEYRNKKHLMKSLLGLDIIEV